MARTAALVKASIWDVGSDFRKLSAGAQRLYLLLLSQPQLTSCGVLTYVPERWARMSSDDTTAGIDAAITNLEQARYILVDRDTGELMIRTFLKHDQVLSKPNVKKSAQREFLTIESERLRNHLVNDWPDVFGTPSTPPDYQPAETGSETPSETPSETGSETRSPRVRARAPRAHDRTTGTYTSTDIDGDQGSNAAAANLREPEPADADAAAFDILLIDKQLTDWQVGRQLRLAARADLARAKACIRKVLAEPEIRTSRGALYRTLWEDGVNPDIDDGAGRQRRTLLDAATSLVDNLAHALTLDELKDEIAKLERRRGEQLTVDQVDQLERRHANRRQDAA